MVKGFVFLMAIGAMLVGGQGIYDALRNRAPETLSCEQANKSRPESEWLHVTGCRVSVLEAAYETNKTGELTGDIFLPLKAGAVADDKAVHYVRFVLKTKDPNIATVVKEMAALDSKDQSALFAYLGKNAKRLMFDKDVSGMVQSGLNKDDKIQARLRDLNRDLAADFVVLEDGKEPSLVKSALFLVGGIAVFLFMGSLAARKA